MDSAFLPLLDPENDVAHACGSAFEAPRHLGVRLSVLRVYGASAHQGKSGLVGGSRRLRELFLKAAGLLLPGLAHAEEAKTPRLALSVWLRMKPRNT